MDSGNSGSVQSSSSGGDDEYDESSSRAESDLPPTALFLNPSVSSSPFGAIPSSQASALDLLSSPSNYLLMAGASFPSAHPYNLHGSPHGMRLQPNPLLHFEPLQPGSQRSENAGFTDFSDIHVDQSSSGGQNVLAVGGPILSRNLAISGQDHHQPPAPSLPYVSRAPGDQMNASRNPKKRTRASRRAPTTVLTTDTTNFRAMVQEFTGIPEPPFSGSSFSRRLDLFGSGSGLRSGSHLDSFGTGAYPFRPSPQKVASSSSPSSSPSLLNTNIRPSAASTNMPHPLLTFQSFIQSQGNIGITSAFEEVAMAGGNLNASSEGISGHHGVRDPNIAAERPSGSGAASQRITSCKLNYSTTSLSEMNHDKGLGNIVSSSRGEGAVDSWICPSD